MKQFRRTLAWCKVHLKAISIIGAVVAALIVVGVAINYVYIGSFSKYMRSGDRLPDTISVGIVLGGGIQDGKPRPLLKDRLETASRLLEQGKVRKLILSGDNRFNHYNEPQVMKNYLVREKGVDPEKLQLDNAGRSTYETCERAKEIFDLDTTILISESTHLPRAIYLCRSFGIEAYGHKSDGQSSAGLRIGQNFREIMARTKATLNIYIIGENTVLGDKIRL